MASALERVWNVTELLESILSKVDDRDVLVNAQRVSKRWRDVIKASPTTQKALFFRPSSVPLAPFQTYSVNRFIVAALPFLFNKLVSTGGDLEPLKPYGDVTIGDLACHFDFEFRRKWLADNASWRGMLVSQPPIKKVQWQVWKVEKMDQRVILPPTLVELEFPEGLRTGDLYDLILGTRGSHETIWPYMDKVEKDPPSLDEIIRWLDDENWRAYEEHAIIVRQFIAKEPKKPAPRREDYWCPRDLQVYHQNVRAIKCLEIETSGPWSYKEQNMDSASAAKKFLRETLEMIP
ncbi:hypothetical protein K445DRAFT_20353 [Daldinia sp. EC12]|nr:hypothetical protein K445DRAFT_20353 [Daldinia sp. EC12]